MSRNWTLTSSFVVHIRPNEKKRHEPVLSISAPFHPLFQTLIQSSRTLLGTSSRSFSPRAASPPSVVTIEDHIVYIVSGADYILQADQWQKINKGCGSALEPFRDRLSLGSLRERNGQLVRHILCTFVKKI